MKKIILILIFFLSAVSLSFGQDTIRSLRIGEWGITLEEGVTYTIETTSVMSMIKCLHAERVSNS